ncbi:MAG TPA: SRPBCC family protein [Gammaproteobacteria bacterium]|jgi:hypothetical protein|nr:SRPBCC family protein [Gammaproteobacteria bacterium]
MVTVNMAIELNAAADKAWSLIGGYNDLPNWHPALKKSELSENDSVRTLFLVGGGEVVDKLLIHNDNERTCSYAIVDSPLPVADYSAELKVIEQGSDKSTVEWSAEFNADGAPDSEAIGVIEGIFHAGFDTLKDKFGG